MVQLTYANQGWRCTSPTLSKHLCSTRSVWVFKRCSESVWKVHKRHAWSTQKVSSKYQAVNHLRDYFLWITSRRQAQFLPLYLSWSIMPQFCPDNPHDWKGRTSVVSAMVLIQWKRSYRGFNSWYRKRKGPFTVFSETQFALTPLH